MAAELKETRLARLRQRIGTKAEKAYSERDAADDTGSAQAYAAGKSHAFGVAEDEVRKAEKEPPTQA